MTFHKLKSGLIELLTILRSLSITSKKHGTIQILYKSSKNFKEKNQSQDNF